MNCDGAGVQQVYNMFEMNIGKEERTNTWKRRELINLQVYVILKIKI